MSDMQIEPKKQKSFGDILMKLQPQIERALPGAGITADRLLRISMTAIRQTPKLLQCDQASLLGSIMQAAQLGLEPNTNLGQCYLIPYKTQAQFQLGYKGLIELAWRTGMFSKITASKVDEADTFEYEFGTNAFYRHVPSDQPTGKVTHYYAEYQLVPQGGDFKVWSREKAESHGKQYSKSYSREDSPWQTNFDAMAMKSVVIDALRLAPKSAESQLARALAADNGFPKTAVKGNDLALEVDFDAIREGE